MPFSEGSGFDGAAVGGFARVQESDMLAVPDAATFQVLPWVEDGGRGCRPDVLRCPHSAGRAVRRRRRPCEVLRRNLAKARDMADSFYVHPEMEFFLFKESTTRPRSTAAPASTSCRWTCSRISGCRRPDARGDGHLRRVLPPRGRPQPGAQPLVARAGADAQAQEGRLDADGVARPRPGLQTYLAFAVVAAGLRGIEKDYELPPEAEDNIYEMTDAERRARITRLPHNLDGALRVMEESELVAEAVGEHVFEFFLRNKRVEWEEYWAQVTPYELRKYLPIL